MDTGFEEYLKQYCETYEISEEAAKEQAVVKEVQKYYEEEGSWMSHK